MKVGIFLGALVVAALVTGAATGTHSSTTAAPKGIPLFSEWVDAWHGWSVDADGQARLYGTDDGGRTWDPVFVGSNYLFNPTVRTSRGAGIVSTGRQAGATFWTNDGGRRWYGLGLIDLGAAASGRGNLLFWHRRRDTLYRVEGWPPRGAFPCRPSAENWPGPQPRGRRVCLPPPGDAGMRSIVAGRLDSGAFGEMRSVPGGIVAPVDGTNDHRLALYRTGSLSVTLLPAVPLAEGEQLGRIELAAAWPRLYGTASLQPHGVGTGLWRSGDGGRTWWTAVSRQPAKRLTGVRGPVRIGARAWLPGGFIAGARARGRGVVVIRQVGRSRVLVLPGAAKCSRIEPRVDWPQVFVEGRRAGRTVAVWSSADGGGRWTQFGHC